MKAVPRRSFTRKANSLLTPLASPTFVSRATRVVSENSALDSRQYFSLWNTGATFSMITKRVVEDLELQPAGQINLHHAGGRADGLPIFYVNMLLYNNVEIRDVRVGLVTVRDLDVIIGMDIINRGDFAVSNKNGATTFSFRIPSIEDFDFVRDDESYKN